MSTYSITIKVQGGGKANKQSGVNGEDTSAGVGVGGSSGGANSQAGQLAQGGGSSAINTLKKVAVATGAVAAGTKVLNYVTSRVYTETGNRQLQDNINAAKQVSGQIMSIISGFAVGGIAGGIIAAGGVALDYALQYRSYNFARQQEAQVLNIRQERAGLASMANSRSRALNQ